MKCEFWNIAPCIACQHDYGCWFEYFEWRIQNVSTPRDGIVALIKESAGAIKDIDTVSMARHEWIKYIAIVVKKTCPEHDDMISKFAVLL